MSNRDTIPFLTPVGRLVSGDVFKAITTDANGNPLLVKSGPNAGQPTQNYSFGVAFEKNNVEYAELWAIIEAEAKACFPQYFDASGNCILPTFSWKITDGDSQVPNTKQIKPCDREGYPGHWVVFFSGSFAPKLYTAGGASIITDPEAIKKGYYVRVSGSVVGNENAQKPGVYVNHSMVELIGYGEEISSGPDGAAVFGGTPAAAMPAGVSATPIAPAAGPKPAGPAGPAGPGGGPVAPATDFLNPAEKSYIVEGAVYTESQLTGFGWTPQQIAAAQPAA
ncbi:MAG: DUF2815 family protein [Proteobacteria bacterium]|nr:DUF2815 family protein [Pseudomonadota bacterium]